MNEHSEEIKKTLNFHATHNGMQSLPLGVMPVSVCKNLLKLKEKDNITKQDRMLEDLKKEIGHIIVKEYGNDKISNDSYYILSAKLKEIHKAIDDFKEAQSK